MKVVHTFDELATVSRRVCLAIGVFDGVHLGHQRVIGQAGADARVSGGTAVVLTFDPHPMRVLQPDKAPRLLTSTPHKLRLIEQLGVDVCLVLHFDRAFSLMPAERFIEQVVHRTNQLLEICVGGRFRFGHNRAGDVRLIAKLGAGHGFAVKEIAPVELAGHVVSSTAVRQQVLAGHLDRVAAMLGRPFSVLGTVVPGDRRGRQLGFPTANLDPHSEALPPDGVYAVRAVVDARPQIGVANIGLRPTFASTRSQRVFEVHLLDFDGDLYRREIEVVFLQKIRAERTFESADALRSQIAADIQAARQLLGS
jgi:riboflavin kinase/FMN adenylyltransferase